MISCNIITYSFKEDITRNLTYIMWRHDNNAYCIIFITTLVKI